MEWAGAALARIGQALGAGFDGEMLWLVRDGQRAWFSYAERDGYAWTYADAELPRSFPLVLYARPAHPTDADLVTDGKLSPLSVGNPAFDARYYVEAAPADVGRALLDAEGRALFARMPAAELTTLELDARLFLRLAVPGAATEPDAAVALLDEVSAFALRVGDAYAAVAAAALASPTGGDPFRPALDPAVEAAAETARTTDLARIQELALARNRWSPITATSVVIVTVLLILLLAL